MRLIELFDNRLMEASKLKNLKSIFPGTWVQPNGKIIETDGNSFGHGGLICSLLNQGHKLLPKVTPKIEELMDYEEICQLPLNYGWIRFCLTDHLGSGITGYAQINPKKVSKIAAKQLINYFRKIEKFSNSVSQYNLDLSTTFNEYLEPKSIQFSSLQQFAQYLLK